MWKELLQSFYGGNTKALARIISLVENEAAGYEEILQTLSSETAPPVIGITGPPGAGKSTLTDALIEVMVNEGKKVGVLCVDPSSPFNLGAVLGDRIRMGDWYTHPNVFIRSLATRGSMGGLHPKIIEITDLLKAFQFDYIIVETVGVGQSEIEIAGLADLTAVVMVPEAGDEVQTMKAGLMEIADVFVVNKSDRPGADTFIKNLRMMLAPAFSRTKQEIPIVKTAASQKAGIEELYSKIVEVLGRKVSSDRKYWLLAEKAFYLIEKKRMKSIDKTVLKKEIEERSNASAFNLYAFVEEKDK